MLWNPNANVVVQADRPTVIPDDSFAEMQRGIGSLSIIARDLPDEVTDEGWCEWINACEGNLELAIESFLSQWQPDEARAAEVEAARVKAEAAAAKAKQEAEEAAAAAKAKQEAEEAAAAKAKQEAEEAAAAAKAKAKSSPSA